MLAWTVGVSLVFMLLLIWSALYRESLRVNSARDERDPAKPGQNAEAGASDATTNAANQAAGK